MTPTSLEQERMSNVQKAEEAALRVLGHLSSNGTYTVVGRSPEGRSHMNKQRRKAIEEVSTSLETLKGELEELDLKPASDAAKGAVAAIKAALENIDLESIKDEESEYFDNMPEGFQQGEKGQKAESAIESLDSAISAIEEAAEALGTLWDSDEPDATASEVVCSLEEAIGFLGEAAE